MIASVLYNDLRGTAAADISDFYANSLQEYLIKTFESYDSKRYVCQGCTIWVSGQETSIGININYICWDRQNDTYVCFRPAKEFNIEEILSIFKRFEIVIGKDINEIEINEDNTLTLE
jgi:hypothetical protein